MPRILTDEEKAKMKAGQALKVYPPFEPPVRLPLEPDMAYHLRWVQSVQWHPEEPRPSLAQLRKMRKKQPLEFFKLYADWQTRYEKILAKHNETPEAGKGESPKPRDEGTVKCLELVRKLLDKINKKIAAEKQS